MIKPLKPPFGRWKTCKPGLRPGCMVFPSPERAVVTVLSKEGSYNILKKPHHPPQGGIYICGEAAYHNPHAEGVSMAPATKGGRFSLARKGGC